MSRRLPSLNGLKAFEAAARHLSFTRAAAELNVTQAAVSHQVKALEERLGLALFRRLNRALLLTDEGQALLPPMSDALDRMALAVDGLARREETGVLTVSTLDSFAAGWLVRRLRRFRALYPDIEIRIATSNHLVDFTRDDVDISVRYGRGEWPALDSVRLMTEEIFPVCSPALLADGPPLEKPQDLRYHTLLHEEMLEDWRMWLLAAGVGGVDPTRGPWYTQANLVI